jgi:hypothetical protein
MLMVMRQARSVGMELPILISAQVVYNTFLDVVNQRCPELHPERLQMVFPEYVIYITFAEHVHNLNDSWKSINWDDPAESLLKRPAVVPKHRA